MSEFERRDERPDCGHDAAAYVLGALEPHEVEPFRRHLRGCVVCRDEVAALGEVVAALPMAAPQLAVDPALRQVKVSTPDGITRTYRSGQEIPLSLFPSGTLAVDAIFNVPIPG